MHAHDLRPSAAAPAVPARAKTVTERDAELVELALDLCRAMTAAGVSCSQVARACRVSASRVKAWRNPLRDGVPNWRHELRIRRRLPALYDALQRERREASPPARSLERAALRVAREHGELAEALLDALADGNISVSEARRIAREAADLEAQAAAIRRRAEEIAG